MHQDTAGKLKDTFDGPHNQGVKLREADPPGRSDRGGRKPRLPKFGLAAFLIPLCIRAVPEIIVGPYHVGFDTIAFYAPNTLDWAMGKPGSWKCWERRLGVCDNGAWSCLGPGSGKEVQPGCRRKCVEGRCLRTVP
jgi:hypothetical protein